MIRYNWNDIRKYTKDKPELVLDYFKNVYVLKGEMYDFVQRNKYAKQIIASKEIKSSYLLNIDDLIINREKATEAEQFIYLDLASKRDAFSLFNSKGRTKYLHEWEIGNDYSIEKLKTNRLLMFSDKKIYFIFEEGEEDGISV